MKLPVITIAILAGQAAYANASGGSLLDKLDAFQSLYTGMDFIHGGAGAGIPQFAPERLIGGYGPWIVKRFIGAIARPRVPFRGLPISLS